MIGLALAADAGLRPRPHPVGTALAAGDGDRSDPDLADCTAVGLNGTVIVIGDIARAIEARVDRGSRRSVMSAQSVQDAHLDDRNNMREHSPRTWNVTR